MANDLTRQLLEAWQTSANLRAFSHVVRQGETNQTDTAYREYYGGGLADDLADHYYRNRPHAIVTRADGSTYTTSPFGAYQAELATWDDFQDQCGKRDMSPPNQDLFFVWCVNKRGALKYILAGYLRETILLCRKEWTSLPGAAENNPKWNYAAAEKIYEEYGGVVSRVVGAPLQPEQPDVVLHSSPELPPRKENTMLTGFLSQLLMSVVGGFLNQSTAQQVTSIVNKDGAQSSAAQALLSTLLRAVAGAAGVTPEAMQASDKIAIAATSAVQGDPVKVQSVEDIAAQHLAAVAPFVDKLAQLDAARWAAEDKGRSNVSTIAIEEHKAGLWDMTGWIVKSLLLMLWGVAWGLLAAILWLTVRGGADSSPAMLTALIGLAGPIWTGAIVASVTAIVAYRFDGSKASQAAAEAQNAIRKYDAETQGGQP